MEVSQNQTEEGLIRVDTGELTVGTENGYVFDKIDLEDRQKYYLRILYLTLP